MNNKKKLGAAFISLAVSGLAGLMLVAPGALANGQGVGGSVLTKQACDWRITEVDASFTLESALADPTNVESESNSRAIYDGTPITISSAEQSQNVYVTGNSQTVNSDSDNTRCIFYQVGGAVKTRPTVVMKTGTQVFTASYPILDGNGDPVLEDGNPTYQTDADMEITLGGISPLGVAFSDPNTCSSEWSNADLSLNASEEATALEIASLSDILVAQQKDSGQRCDQPYVVSLQLPGGVVPDSPGAVYTYSGIVLTTTLTALDTAGE